MRIGAWHQFGWNSQKMIVEELENGAGSGVILSPRDLKQPQTEDYAQQYIDLGAEVLYDPQWHVPNFTNDQLVTYPRILFGTLLGHLAKFQVQSFAR